MLFTLLAGSIFTIMLIIYFFPYMVALGRGSQSLQFIAVLNVAFGWCVVGWVASLIWAFANAAGKAKVGRIVLLLALLAILGYLSAYTIGAQLPAVQAHFDAVVTQQQQHIAAK